MSWQAQRDLNEAAKRLDVEGMRSALKRGADPNRPTDRYGIPISLAREVSQAERPKEFSPPTPDVADARRVAAMRLLVEYGLHVDEGVAFTMALDVIQQCGPLTVQYALDLGVDVNEPFGAGSTLLHFAQTAHAVRILIAAGADFATARDSDGRLPLEAAICFSNQPAAVAQAFMEAGAAINDTDDAGETALHRIVHRCMQRAGSGDVETVTHFLALGADPTLSARTAPSPLELTLTKAAALTQTSTEKEVARLKVRCIITKMVTRAVAWQRRRHLLAACRDKLPDASSASDSGAGGGDGTGTGSGAAAAGAVALSAVEKIRL